MTHTNSPISILMPVYNGAKFLCDSLESVLAQTLRPLEFVIVDDASTDSTPKILDEMLVNLTWTRRYRNQKNLGGVKNFIRCTDLAQSDYFVVLNADDKLAPTFIEKMTATARAYPNACFIFSDFYRIDETGNRLRQTVTAALKPGLIAGHDMIDQLISRGQQNAVSMTVIRREAYREAGGTDPKMDTIHDYDSYLRMSGRGMAYYVDEPLGELRLHQGAWSERTNYYDDGSGDHIFKTLSSYTFMTQAQQRRYVEGLCDHYRRMFFRWLRKPDASLADVRRIRTQIKNKIDGWADSGVRQSQFVRKHSRLLRHRLAWAVTGFPPSLWLFRQLLRRRHGG
jgi:glycosyltransferase involved in cell wall biosynthesis